jgi:hypothetical protein
LCRVDIFSGNTQDDVQRILGHNDYARQVLEQEKVSVGAESKGGLGTVERRSKPLLRN